MARTAVAVAAPLLAAFALTATTLAAQGGSPADLERFEREVRPLLAERCSTCHGATKQKSGLRVDHGEFLRRGGERGPAIVPGDASSSRLVHAVRYDDVDLQMPPKGKLSAAEIATLERWIDAGAPWPDEPLPPPTPEDGTATKSSRFDLDARKADHWCWQPLQPADEPSTRDADWARTTADRFILAGLEARGLEPAPPAAPAVLLRRLSFDLTGLPPSPDQVRAFLADPSPAAYERVVDELLASPQFGVRWARHWLDLVRYAETLGHEFDFAIPHAWRYRDWVIRALNADVPYDRFVLEHVAGDLLPEPRRDPETGRDESTPGTASWWFGDQTHSPVDVRQHESDRIDNQIDVLSKTFLGVTVACARCHDHKFDAISTRDYYAMFGVVKSSRYQIADVVDRRGEAPARENMKRAVQALLEPARRRAEHAAQDVERYLHVARSLGTVAKDDREQTATDAARAHDLDPDRLRRWLDAVAKPGPLKPWLDGTPHRRRGARPAPERAWRDRVLADFGVHGFADWHTHGTAFGDGPVDGPLHVVPPAGDKPPHAAWTFGPFATSARAGREEQGSLVGPDFTIDRRYLHVLAMGQGARFNIVLEGFNVIRDPIYGRLKHYVDAPQPRWYRIDLDMWSGRSAYLQFQDLTTEDPSARRGAEDGWIAVQRAVLSDDPKHPVEAGANFDASGSLSAVLARALATAAGDVGPHDRELVRWLARRGLLDADAPAWPEDVLHAHADAARHIAAPIHVPAMADGPGTDHWVHVRGGHRNPGDPVHRGYLEAFAGRRVASRGGSGRLRLARQIVDPSVTPNAPRVAVNRVWHLLFGRGLVATVDNFGVLGEKPTHPELLDTLAARFVEQGWRLKPLIRELVTSSTYRMSSRADPRAAEVDPDNRLLHRARVRRLEGEIVRDTVLAVSGRLDPKLFGRGVATHLTRFMDGRGRPGSSGPLDGDGRRSVFLEVRRNFLNPMFLAFDTPMPFSTVGRRSVSNVPAQALVLMNDPLVLEQARRWSTSTADQPMYERLDSLYLATLGREPTGDERERARSFLAHATGTDADRAWADLCHVLFNTKEFVFLQ